MASSRVDRAFARFASKGDPRALAKVFDATAGELHRVAWHLVGDRHAAEDLVQMTFLVAIQDAPSYDHECSVLCWLCGILTHRALDLRRTQRLRSGKPLPPRPGAVEDPVASAVLGELSAVVAERVRELPEPYREVLMLHLLHELSAREIADALGRADGTVRSQIHRGLDMLRRALPAGIAGTTACPPRASLAVVRAAVLAKVGPVAAANAVTFGGLGGTLVMQKLTVAAFLVTAASLFVWNSLRSSEAAVPADATDAVAAHSGPGTSSRGSLATTEPIERELAPAKPADSLTALEVSVRWKTDGKPAVDVVVIYRPAGNQGELQLQSVRTTVAGVARFAPVAAGECFIRVDRQLGLPHLRLIAGQTHRTTVELSAGVAVRGRVVDTNQRPVMDADLWLFPQADPGWGGVVVARSASDGGFDLVGVEPGVFLGAWGKGFAPSRLQRVETNPDGEDLVLEVVPTAGTLEGTVFSSAGTPVRDATVFLQFSRDPPQFQVDAQLSWKRVPLRSDAQGRFCALGLMPANWIVWTGAPGFAPARQVVNVASTFPTSVQIHLFLGAGINGCVTDAAGTPVDGAKVEVLHEAVEPCPKVGYEGPDWARIAATTGPDGRYALPHIMPGRMQVVATKSVQADGRRKELRLTQAFELADQQQVTWNPVLGRGLLLHGVVLDPDSRPLLGWTVQSPLPTPLPPVRTDTEGRFRWDQAEDTTCQLQVIAADSDMVSEASVTVVDVRPGPDALRIVVPWARIPNARVTGRVLAPDGTAPKDLRLLVSRLGEDGRLESASSNDKTSDGHFQSRGIVPGRHFVQVTCPDFGVLRLGEYDVARGATVDLGVHHYPEPGSLTLEVVGRDGKPIPDARLTLRNLDEPFGTLLYTAEQQKGVPRLQPGRYVLATWGNLTMACSQPIEILPGRTTHHVFTVPDGVRIVVHLPQDHPGDYLLRQTWRDARGVLAFDGVGVYGKTDQPIESPQTIPPGRYSIEVWDASGRTATTTADIHPSDPPLVVLLPLPKRQ